MSQPAIAPPVTVIQAPSLPASRLAPLVWAAEREGNARTWRAIYLRECRSARMTGRLDGRSGSRALASRQLLHGRLGLLHLRVARDRDDRGRPVRRRDLVELRAEMLLVEADVLRIKLDRLRSSWTAIGDEAVRIRTERLGRSLAARLANVEGAIAAYHERQERGP